MIPSGVRIVRSLVPKDPARPPAAPTVVGIREVVKPASRDSPAGPTLRELAARFDNV